jgi:hypothetical protein
MPLLIVCVHFEDGLHRGYIYMDLILVSLIWRN